MKYSFKLWRYWMTREPFDLAKELADGKVSNSTLNR
jgi:hypothetical protein